MSQVPGSSLLLSLCLMLALACTGSPTPSTSPARRGAPATPAVTPYPEVDSAGNPIPPVARKVPTTTTAAGRTLHDDYGWLENRDDPQVIAYLEAENHYTEGMTAHTKDLEKELYEEMVGRLQETDLSVPYRRGGHYYYSREEEGRQYSIYCRKAGSLDGPEEVILDQNTEAEGHDFFRLGALEVSPDGRLLAWSFDTDGSERFTVRIKNLETGELYPDRIEEASWGLTWGNDNRTLFYRTLDETARPYRLWRHTLGADVAQDELLYQEDDGAFFVNLGKSRSQRYLLMSVDSATTSEVRVLAADTPDGSFRTLIPRQHGVEVEVVHQGGYFYIRTNEGARNFKLVRAPIGDPSREHWEEVLPERADITLNGVEAFARHLVLLERRDGLLRVRVRSLDEAGEVAAGTDHEVDFPEPVYTVRLAENLEYDTDLLRLSYTSLVTPLSIFDYDMGEHTRTLLKQTEVRGGYNPGEYTSERIRARAPDGTEIPLSLVYRRGLALDGSNPCMLYGYGSYGISMEPRFSTQLLSLLDRGFVYAIAHVRGGGEMGEAWHDAGKLMHKNNTFTDFIAAAEHLIRSGYTSPRRLAIRGGSAGGLLVGAAVNLRPDLFAAAVAHVPFVDVMNTMLDPDLPLTVTEYEEWGNPNEPEAFDVMRAYSPYDNVRAQAYPRMLITGGLNDPRVSYWEPAKWAAKLRAMKTDDHPLLLKIHMGAGHGGTSGRYRALEETAFEFAFLIDVLGAGDG